MKRSLPDIIIFVVIVIFGVIISRISAHNHGVDIQLHDTYYVLSTLSAIVLVVGVLTFIVFSIKGGIERFKSLGSNMGLLVGLVLVSIITYYIIEIKASLQNQAEISDSSNFQLMWGILLLWILAFILLSFRTLKVWKKAY
ncbi:hypothetical protein [Fulvivirga ligni]|uniref:hypothetical protein n=1 Tax=Fulvivirga ligni TaxID=2904246 RepID=UPI001F36450D|nr:hypothetical protein [Fulvivirga ligni]UII23208.1 hypothetical protein LVD16_08205 [Fulvivirga ligni]